MLHVVERCITGALAGQGPGGDNSTRFCIGNLNLIRDRDQYKQRLPRFIQQEFGWMSCNLDVANFCVTFGTNERYFTVVFSRVLAAIPDVENLRMRIIRDTIGAQFQLDGINKFESVAAKNAEHSVVPARDKKLVERRHVRNALRFLETRNTSNPLPCPEADSLDGSVLQSRYEKALTFNIDVEVIESTLHVRYRNRLYKPQKLLRFSP